MRKNILRLGFPANLMSLALFFVENPDRYRNGCNYVSKSEHPQPHCLSSGGMLTERITRTKQMYKESCGNKEKRKRLWKGLVPRAGWGCGDWRFPFRLSVLSEQAGRQACRAARHAALGCALRADVELRVINLLVHLKLSNHFVSSRLYLRFPQITLP
jgi:hypothetical protein